MRTVDPDIWHKTYKKPSIKVTRSMKYGQRTISGLEYRIRASFGDAMTELQRNGFKRRWKLIADENIGAFEKYTYTFLLVMTAWCGVSVLTYSWYRWSSQPPLVTSLQSRQQPVQLVPFPAVALCPNNIISTSMLNNYAKFLMAKDKNRTYTEEAIRRNLLQFGALLAIVPVPVDARFTQFLARHDPGFNVTHFMFKVAPRCGALLRRCGWRGRAAPCGALFASRVTPLGFCCVFNSHYQPEDMATPPKTLDLVGQDNGLSVVIRENDDDSAFLRRASVGVEALIFDGSEYPLLESGAARLYPLQRDASVFLPLRVNEESTDDGLRYYTESWRGCRMGRGEGEGEGGSSAWCLARCRRQTAGALCGCAPYTLPQGEGGAPACTLSDLKCLNKHREKFLYYYPGEAGGTSEGGGQRDALAEERQDGQACEQCAPDCARRRPAASPGSAPHPHTHRGLFQNFFTRGLSLTNTTVLRVFYSTKDQQHFVVEANVRWFEAFASIASQWMILTGVTTLGITEVIFHCTIRWRHHYMRRTKINNTPAPSISRGEKTMDK